MSGMWQGRRNRRKICYPKRRGCSALSVCPLGYRRLSTNSPCAVAAEVLLRCGTLTRQLGNVRNVAGAQEQAQDMLSEAARVFRSERMPARVSETQYELAMCRRRRSVAQVRHAHATTRECQECGR